MDIHTFTTLKDAMYTESSVPEILRKFIVDLKELSQTEHILDFYIDSIEMLIEEYLKLIDETDKDENPVVAEMRFHAQNLKRKFRENNLNHFDVIMRRKSLISLFSKMNRVFREGRSVDSINDLLGIEFVLHTRSLFDNSQTIENMYKMSNLTLEYFFNSNEHKGYRYSPVDTSKIKNAISAEHTIDEIETLKRIDPHIFIPDRSMINPHFINIVKDYFFQPKIDTAYRGIQYVMKSEKGFSVEAQLKTQPVRDFLDDPDSPGNHKKHKSKQAKKKISPNVKHDIIQFDVDFEPEKMRHIYGFRENPQFDRSGILQAIKWDLSRSTHPNNN